MPSVKILLFLSVVLSQGVSSGKQYFQERNAEDQPFYHLSDSDKQNDIVSHNSWDLSEEKQALFSKYLTYYGSSSKESTNLTLNGKTDWQMPKWANGIFISSGPSEQETDGYDFNHYFDGLGRYSSFRLQDGEVIFTSKMLKSKYYKSCKANHEAVSNIQFAETTPARWTSYFPFMNMIGAQYHGDNNWVALERLADKKTFVGTTDTQTKLQIDINTLDAQDWIKWEDNQRIVTGVSHSQTHRDGSVISVGMTVDNSFNYKYLVYRMAPEDHLNRKIIAEIPIDKVYFLHSFALTDNYAVIYLPPAYFKDMLYNMVAGKDMKAMFTEDMSDTTKMYVIDLRTGELKKFDSKRWMFTVHFGQAYETADGEIVVEVPSQGTAKVLIDAFMRDDYTKIENMKNQNTGSKLNRCIFNFQKGTVEIVDLLTVTAGVVDFPQLNWDAKVSQFTYLSHVNVFPESANETLSWPVVKFDSRHGELGGIVGQWGPNMTLAQEVRFVANPDAKTEDDGILLTVAFNVQLQETSLYVIDAKTMTTLQQYPLPYTLPQGFHAEYYSEDQV